MRRFQDTQRSKEQNVATMESQVTEGLKIIRGVRGEFETFQGRVVETVEELRRKHGKLERNVEGWNSYSTKEIGEGLQGKKIKELRDHSQRMTVYIQRFQRSQGSQGPFQPVAPKATSAKPPVAPPTPSPSPPYYTGDWPHWSQPWQPIPSTLPLPHQPRRGASHFRGA